MRSFGIIILGTIPLVVSGCGRPDTDVTSAPAYNFESFSGTVWKTKVKTALVRNKGPGGAPYTDFSLLVPRHFDPTHPEFTSSSNDDEIIEVLPPGTRLRIKRLMKNNGNWGGVWVEAVLEDGPHSQKAFDLSRWLLAKNRFLRASESEEWGVDPDMLEKAK